MQDATLRKEFGARLKTLRKQKAWSQKELAAKVDIRFQLLEALGNDDQETVIKVIDAIIAKQRMESALATVDQDT